MPPVAPGDFGEWIPLPEVGPSVWCCAGPTARPRTPTPPAPWATLLLLIIWFLCYAYSIFEVIAPGPWLVAVAVLVRTPPLPAPRCCGDIAGYLWLLPSAARVPLLPCPCKLAPEKLRIGAVMLTSYLFLVKLLAPPWGEAWLACGLWPRAFRFPA